MSEEQELPDFDELMTESYDRASLVRRAAAVGLALGLAPYVATSAFAASGRAIKIGYVTPRTGPYGEFGEADVFVIRQMGRIFRKGLKVGKNTHPVQIIGRDSQSNSNRAATVAQSLILDDNVDLILVAGTPDTTNPVADTCEANKVPCISSVAPWQPYFFGRKGDPAKGFKYTYHFFWGLEDVIGVFTRMWATVPTNKVVGGLFPNDPDGNAWGAASSGSPLAPSLPPSLSKKGYKVIDPGRYPTLNDDFSSQIAAFKKAKVQIVTGVPIPPDWTTFWTQALQQGFHPRIASIGKALLFPSAPVALGSHGAGMSSEVWWSPSHPYKSSLTGQSAAAVAAAYEKSAKKQWTQPIGFAHALFELAANALSRAKDIESAESIAAAIKATSLDTIVGHVQWKGGPVPNVAKTKLVGGQWQKGKKFKYELVIVENKAVPAVKRGGKLVRIPY
jgi:branched-chain amino acid transport system substrate-binding protein